VWHSVASFFLICYSRVLSLSITLAFFLLIKLSCYFPALRTQVTLAVKYLAPVTTRRPPPIDGTTRTRTRSWLTLVNNPNRGRKTASNIEYRNNFDLWSVLWLRDLCKTWCQPRQSLIIKKRISLGSKIAKPSLQIFFKNFFFHWSYW
jgi:hypothetical protein